MSDLQPPTSSTDVSLPVDLECRLAQTAALLDGRWQRTGKHVGAAHEELAGGDGHYAHALAEILRGYNGTLRKVFALRDDLRQPWRRRLEESAIDGGT